MEQKKVGCMAVPELWTWFLLAAVWKLVISLMLTFLHFQVCMTLSQEPVPPLYKKYHLGKDRCCVGCVALISKALLKAGVREHGNSGTSSCPPHLFCRTRLQGSIPVHWCAAHMHALAHTFLSRADPGSLRTVTLPCALSPPKAQTCTFLTAVGQLNNLHWLSSL